MSLPLIAHEIARFLSSKDPEILCIKGRWGVGKTYAWRRFLMDAQKEKRIGYDKYSYISLFGRNSLLDLRNSVTENTVPTSDVQAKPSLTSLEGATVLPRQAFQKAGFLASLIPQSSGYAQLGQRMLYLFVRNTIVCLDDLERAGSGLHMKDVLGLASQLKDEKSCKVVILLNDEKLAQEAKDDFGEQLEKVADVVINFELSPKEAVDIALDAETIFYENLRENCIKLKIDNIRVIKKAEKFCKRLVPLLSRFDDRLLHQAIHTTTIACYAKYQPDKAPSFELIRAFNPWDATLRTVNGDKKEVSPQYVTLQEYGFSSIDGFDEVVLDAVERGFFDEEKLDLEASQIDSNLKSNDMKGDYIRAWEIYRGSFARNEDTLAKALIEAVERNIEVIEPPNLDSVVNVLREIGYEERASKLVKFFMANKEEGPSYWDPKAFEYHGRIKDLEVQAAMLERHKSLKGVLDPFTQLKKVGEREVWDNEDLEAIVKITEDELVKIFMSLEGKEFDVIVSAYRTFLSVGYTSPSFIEISRRGRRALNRIAGESRLNARRVKSLFHDIDLDASD